MYIHVHSKIINFIEKKYDNSKGFIDNEEYWTKELVKETRNKKNNHFNRHLSSPSNCKLKRLL